MELFQICNVAKKEIIIAIDGYSACGKSTLAKQLATKLQYTYIDSGAMYRAITLYFLRHQIDWSNEQNVISTLADIHLVFHSHSVTGQSEIFLNGENVEHAIRDMVVAEKVSEMAAIKPVRDFAVTQQRKMGDHKGIVMDGRDIGTVVFPQAELKIFMIADMEIRVERRFKELHQTNNNITIEEVKKNLVMRDYVDTHRSISPLKQPEDAIVLDNTNMTISQQLQFALKLAREKLTAVVHS